MLCCTQCGGTEIDSDPTRGDSVCTNCGTVVEESQIVSELTFVESSNNTHQVVGQFVPDSGVRPSFRRNGLPCFSKDSREITISNGNRRIAELAGRLHLNSHHSEVAQRCFRMAVQRNFIQGRKTQNVVAACLYIVCRREKTAHMLIDFSDHLQTNVYELGAVFLKLSRLLKLQLPIIDPSLYIHRFANKLEFGDKAHAVSMTALRLVARMNRDWMQTGRRPAGICGSGLFIAAKIHGFRRTVKEIVHVVRICEVTLRKRLSEFEKTASSNMTAEEFELCDEMAATTSQPPAFLANLRSEKRISTERRRREEEQRLREEGEKEKNTDGEEEEEESDDENNQSKKRKPISKLQQLLNKRKAIANGAVTPTSSVSSVVSAQCLTPNRGGALEAEDLLGGEEEGEEENAGGAGGVEDLGAARTTDEGDLQKEVETTMQTSEVQTLEQDLRNERQQEVEEERQRVRAGRGRHVSDERSKYWDTWDKQNEQEDLLTEDLDDTELDAYLTSSEEAKSREIYWTFMNKEYLERQKEKERWALARQMGKVSGSKAPRKRRKAGEEGGEVQAPPPSNKLNRQVVEQLFARPTAPQIDSVLRAGGANGAGDDDDLEEGGGEGEGEEFDEGELEREEDDGYYEDDA